MTHPFPKKSSIAIGFFLLGLFQVSWTQSAPFSRGVNLTNWFQTGGAEEIQLKRYDQKDFEQIKSLGCDVVRLPVNLIAMTSGAPNFGVDPLFYNFLDSVLTWADNTGIHLILDNHTFDPSENTSPDIDQFLYKVWPQIAYRYRDRYDQLYFEILNEPHGISDALWNNIQLGVIDRIRQVDPDRWLVVGPAGWNSFHNLDKMPEYDDEKLIYTFHFYDPFLFTHQGASWTDPSLLNLAGIPFPYNATDMPGLPAEFNGTWIQSSYNDYKNAGTVADVRSMIDIAVAFKNERNVPLFCGEFGVYHRNITREADRNEWYRVVREHLEANGIAWTIWDYHGGFGIFEKNSNGLFEHDLNIPLVEALGLNVPDQTEFELRPDTTGFIVYDDFIGKNIFSAGYSSGPISLYATDGAKEGSYYIRWENPSQYNAIGFDFQPNRDLAFLVENGFKLEGWVRGNRPGAKLDIRFLDSKTGVGNDRPWRIRVTLDETTISWNGQWQWISIPLADFEEQGSWDDNQWYDPIGAFDWSDIDRLEIVDEYGITQPVAFGFDQLAITGTTVRTQKIEIPAKTAVYPNPATDRISIIGSTAKGFSYIITDPEGKRVLAGHSHTRQSIDISALNKGWFTLTLYDKTAIPDAHPFLKH
jgi:endoglucanase